MVVLRICVVLSLCIVFFSVQESFGIQQNEKNGKSPDIDEVMHETLTKIDIAFSNTHKTKTLKGLAEIDRLNDAAAQSLFDWWESVTALCCIVVRGTDPRTAWKKAVEENEPKLNHYLEAICENKLKIANYYLKARKPKKARLLYQRIITSFDPSVFDACVEEAEASLASFSGKR